MTAFDLPLLVFLISAAAGVGIAYDQSAAWSKFWLIVAGVALYSTLARLPETVRVGKREAPVLQGVMSGFPALVVIYFFLTNDWAARLGKVPGLDPAMRWFAAWQPSVAALRVNSNIIGGVIAVLLPLQMTALFQNRARRRAWIGALLVGLSGLGLLMSASRGAWLALALVLLAWVTRPQGAGTPLRSVIWALGVVVVLLVVVLFCVLTPLGEKLLTLRSDRLTVWRNSLDLARDYRFTGLGLGNFEMAYSSYVLLIHVGHTIHAHNLFLDIWLEQGALGLLAFIGLIGSSLWPGQPRSHWTSAALASLSVMLLHGIVDDAFWGYGGRAAFLLFIPFAMLGRSDGNGLSEGAVFYRQIYRAAWGVTVIVLALSFFTPNMQAMLKANVGAVIQTQVELTGYHWPGSRLQDALRRSAQDKLAPAIAWYQSALASERTNATANRRLGQIALSLGQYDTAQSYLAAAYAAAPGQRATRQMLGECYAMAGDFEQAAQLWRLTDMGQGQLQVRQWWYGDYLGEWERVARIAQAAARLGQQSQ